MKKLLIALIILFTQVTAPAIAAKCKLLTNINGYTPLSETRILSKFNWMAFESGKVLSTGTKPSSELQKKCDAIDGKGQYVLPGMIDAHGHVSGLGTEMLRVKLRGATSEADAVSRVKQFAQNNPKSNWILGRGWNQVLWETKTFPTKQTLDNLKLNKPILLRRIDGHAAWANTKALEIAGINNKTPDPQGGKIERDSKGNATGVLIDKAIGLVEKQIPAMNSIELSYAFDKAFAHLLSLGITSVHDAGVSQADKDYYLQKNKQGTLPVRIYGMLAGSSKNLSDWLKQGTYEEETDMLSLRSVKLYSDGALGSSGAAMLAPYSDDKDNRGLLVTEPKQLENLVEQILKSGFQANVHAIGDRGNHNVLNAFEKAYKTVGGKHLRNRIEHAQVVALDDIPRFKQLDLIASMQPVHATSDMNMAEDRVGAQRLKGAYAWQKFLEQGTLIASGSDFPVELAEPFHGFYAAVTRQDHANQPKDGWIPEDKLTPTQALFSFTLDAAYAAHQETTLGSLEKGKWADFILVDRDVIKGSEEDIWKTKVLETWVAGKKLFQAE